MKIRNWTLFVLLTIGYLILCTWRIWDAGGLIGSKVILAVILFLLLSITPGVLSFRIPTVRLRICAHGVLCLRLFVLVLCVCLPIFLCRGCLLISVGAWAEYLHEALICFLVLFFLFWNGMLSVYLASVQLGIRHRAVGLFCGMIPIANMIALRRIIRVAEAEVYTETERYYLDVSRKKQRLCGTRYPILLVHGVFFRDSRLLNYWGRIPQALQTNGATVYYGNHQSAASVADSARELTERIREILAETGCEKVNIIAHSKGGLDCRYAITHCGAAPMVASLTTVNTPHRGCEFADYLLGKLPLSLQKKVADTYNTAMRKLGDHNPDFMAAVRDLRAEQCAVLDDTLTVPKGVFAQSVGSLLEHATGGRFPLNLTYQFVKMFDGPNDGLVSETAFAFGEEYMLLRPTGDRGISHGDTVDMNREDIPGFDVREFYVMLVHKLKQKGL